MSTTCETQRGLVYRHLQHWGGTHLGWKVDFPPVLENRMRAQAKLHVVIQLVQTKTSDRATASCLSSSVDLDRMLIKSRSGWKREHKQLERGYLSGVSFWFFVLSRTQGEDLNLCSRPQKPQPSSEARLRKFQGSLPSTLGGRRCLDKVELLASSWG